MPHQLDPAVFDSLLDLALAEDVGSGDVTTDALVPESGFAKGRFAVREPAVVCGLPVAQAVFARLSPQVDLRPLVTEGAGVEAGVAIATIQGPARAVLTGERLALNFLQRLSGVATAARQFVDAVEGTGAQILDTRKTTPGWRLLEKYAVQVGGASNHPMGLYDQVLIKDNHIEFARQAIAGKGADAVREAVLLARQNAPDGIRIEIEVENLDGLLAATEAGADIVMLDNMTPAETRAALAQLDRERRPKIEASGGIGLENVRAYAEAGVDYISIGALTHSAVAVDIALDFDDA